MKATVKITSVFGNRTIYPADETSSLFARIAGTRTLTQATIDNMKKLGYEIVVQPESL